MPSPLEPDPRPPRPHVFPGTALAAAAIVLLGSCQPPGTEQGLSPLSPRQQLETVRCDTRPFQLMAQTFEARSGAERDSTEWIAVSAANMPVSTVHDCQRLVIDGQFGPLVALLIATARVERLSFGSGTVVADIINYDDPYRPLNIPPTISCLWLAESAAAQSGLIAAVRRPDTGDCASADFAGPPADNLLLLVRKHQYGGSEYPSTGRWMWDPDAGQHFIGLRCGQAWCEIGPLGFTTTTSFTTRDSIPGWYDEQHLAYPGEGGLIPSRVLGRIEPGPDLPDFDRDFPDDATLEGHVATITLAGMDMPVREAYWEKLALNPRVDVHPIRMRHAKEFSWLPPFSKFAFRAKAPGGAWTRLERSDHTHAGAGAVRWAWSDEDEGAWAPCDAGCCKGGELER